MTTPQFRWHLLGCFWALTLVLLLLLGLLSAVGLAATTYYVSQRPSQDIAQGDDARTCDQARSMSTPRASVNRGIACLQPDDTLVIGPGNYDELLVSQSSSSRTCASGDAAVQPGCSPIPNGLSASQRTTLKAAGTETVLSPAGRKLPGGGAAITLLDYARYLHIEGLRIVEHDADGSTGGIYMGNVQYVTLKGNELDDGQIKAGVSSRYVAVVGNHIMNTGKDQCPPDVKPTPANCPHGMYLCGTDHTITDNHVENTSYYGIQVSCEQGGIARIRIERNRVENCASVGIRCGGEDCFVGANVLVGNGTGISVSGSGVVTNNTIHDYNHVSWNPDPYGIWISYGDGSGFVITNNILTNIKSAYNAINNAAFVPPDSSKVHHNMCEVTGNAGCTLIAQDTAIYTNAAEGDFPLKSGSPAIEAGVAGATKDITGRPYTTPDLGAYASGAAPLPPEPSPGPVEALSCTGELGAQGIITMRCTPTPQR